MLLKPASRTMRLGGNGGSTKGQAGIPRGQSVNAARDWSVLNDYNTSIPMIQQLGVFCNCSGSVGSYMVGDLREAFLQV
jgi:hypothetical protein